MADAPEVVASSSPMHSPELTNATTAVDAQSPKSPSSPLKESAGLILSEADRTTPKYAVEEDANVERLDRESPKYPVEEGDRGAEYFAGSRALQSEEAQQGPTGRRAWPQGEEEWKFGLCSCFKACSLCCEATTCPCILAGRRYSRIKDVPPETVTSTNCYCTSCCILILIPLPFYWIMTMSTRREIRFRYGIKGNNCQDCATSAFCPCCALVQEEREISWREKQSSDAGYGRRTEEMKYAKRTS